MDNQLPQQIRNGGPLGSHCRIAAVVVCVVAVVSLVAIPSAQAKTPKNSPDSARQTSTSENKEDEESNETDDESSAAETEINFGTIDVGARSTLGPEARLSFVPTLGVQGAAPDYSFRLSSDLAGMLLVAAAAIKCDCPDSDEPSFMSGFSGVPRFGELKLVDGTYHWNVFQHRRFLLGAGPYARFSGLTFAHSPSPGATEERFALYAAAGPSVTMRYIGNRAALSGEFIAAGEFFSEDHTAPGNSGNPENTTGFGMYFEASVTATARLGNALGLFLTTELTRHPGLADGRGLRPGFEVGLSFWTGRP